MTKVMRLKTLRQLELSNLSRSGDDDSIGLL